MPQPDKLHSATVAHFLAAASSGLDIPAAEKVYLAYGEGGPCRQIQVGGAGTLTFRTANSDQDVTGNVWAGQVLDVQAISIVSGTATDIWVLW